MNGNDIFRAMGEVDDRYLTMAEGFRKESKKMNKTGSFKRKSTSVLLAAALCASVLAVTAAASGWVPGIFQELEKEFPEETVFQAAAQANTEITPLVVEIPKMDASKFVLLEKYYDGETLLMGYDLDVLIPEPVVGFQPDKMLMRQIKRSAPAGAPGWGDADEQQIKESIEKAKKYHLSGSTFAVEQMMRGTLPDAEYEKAWQILEEQGWVCVVLQDAWIGDHILLNGMEHYDPNTNPEALRADYETGYGDCIRMEVLPEPVRNQDTVTVTMKVMTGIQYWYMDFEGNGWVCYGSGEKEEISFDLNKEDAQ